LKHHRLEVPVAGMNPPVRGVKFGWVNCVSELTVKGRVAAP
jgi:hypothetical protein